MAQSTETLATTTTAAQVNPGDSIVTLASLAGVTTSSFLYIDEELLGVERFGVGNSVVCIRGVEGTATALHGSGSIVYIGRGDQFYVTDPIAVPLSPPPVLPYINLRNGKFWQPVGDETGPSMNARYWQEQITVPLVSSLGVNQIVTEGNL